MNFVSSFGLKNVLINIRKITFGDTKTKNLKQYSVGFIKKMPFKL